MTSHDSHRRLTPRLWDTDWLMLRQLSRRLGEEMLRSLKRGQRLVDFGCGSMPYRTLVEDLGVEYLGAEFDGGMVPIAADGKLPMADRSVDAVLSVQVLEHVRNLDLYLGEAARVLKNDGMLLLSTHGTWLYHPHPEDHRRWTRTGLVVDVESRGFKVESIEGLVGPLATTTMIRLTGYAFFLRRIPVLGRFASAILAIVMNSRGWLEDRLTPPSIIQDNGCVYLISCKKTSA